MLPLNSGKKKMWWLFLDNPNNHHIDWNFQTSLKLNQTVTLFLSLSVLILDDWVQAEGKHLQRKCFCAKRCTAEVKCTPASSSYVFSSPTFILHFIVRAWGLAPSWKQARLFFRRLAAMTLEEAAKKTCRVCVCVCLDVCEHPVNSLTRALKPRCRSNTWVTWSAHTQTH